MKRSIYILGIVLLTVALGEAVVRAAAPVLPQPLTWYSGWAETKAELIDEMDRDIDVAFIGDSSTMAALDPNTFDAVYACSTSTFNAAIPAATPEIIADWQKRVVSKRSPGLVIVGLTSRTLSDDDSTPYFESLAVREDPTADLMLWAAEWSALIRHRSVLRDPQRWVAHLRTGGSAEWDAADSKGWAPRGSGDYVAFDPVTTDRSVDPSQMEHLRRLTSDLHDNGVRVVFAWLPITLDWIAMLPSGEEEWFGHRQMVMDLAHATESRFVDLSAMNERSLFVDPLHTNAEGTQRLTNALARDLESSC